MTFCNTSRAILSGISALCPEGETFSSEEHLNSQMHIQLLKIIQNIKYFWQRFCFEESQLPALVKPGAQTALHFGEGQLVSFDDVILLVQPWYSFFANDHI